MKINIIHKPAHVTESYKSKSCSALYLRAYCTDKMSYMPKICFQPLSPPKEKENYNSAAC